MTEATNWIEKAPEDMAGAPIWIEKETEDMAETWIEQTPEGVQRVLNFVLRRKGKQEKLKNYMEDKERKKMIDKMNKMHETKRSEEFPVHILCTGKTKELKHRFYKTVEDFVNLQLKCRTEWIAEDEKYLGPYIMIFYLEKNDIKNGLENVENEYSNLISHIIEEKTFEKKPIIMVICDESHEHTANIIDQFTKGKCYPLTITISLKDRSMDDIKSKVEIYIQNFKESNQAITQDPASTENEDQVKHFNISGQKKQVDNPDKVNQGQKKQVDNPDKVNQGQKKQVDNPDKVNQASELVTKHIEVCCCSRPALPRKAFSSFLERHLPGYSPVWFEPGEKLKGNFPCFVVCFTLSRIEDDVNGVVKELHLPSGCKAMLIVVQNCAQGLAPGPMLHTYINEKIECFTNILYDNGICYSCDINSKATTLIDQFVKERI